VRVVCVVEKICGTIRSPERTALPETCTSVQVLTGSPAVGVVNWPMLTLLIQFGVYSRKRMVSLIPADVART